MSESHNPSPHLSHSSSGPGSDPSVSKQLSQGRAPQRDGCEGLCPSLPLPGLEPGCLGSVGLRGHPRQHTFCELVHSGSVHQVAKGICYRGLLPVPKKEKGTSSHSVRVSTQAWTASPVPSIGLHTHTGNSPESWLPHTLSPASASCGAFFPPLYVPTSSYLPFRTQLCHHLLQEAFPAPLARPPGPHELPYIMLGYHCLCTGGH